MDFTFTLFERRFLMRAHAGAESSYSVVEGATLFHNLERKGKSHVGDLVPMCVLALPCKVNKFDSNRPPLTIWDCLTLLPHRVRSER